MQRAFLVLASVLAVPAAHAASGVVLPDLSGIDAALEAHLNDQERQDAALEFDESAELFPAVEAEGESSIEDAREDRVADYVVIRVGAKDVTLRDVPLKEWFAPYVRAIAELQLVSGYRDAAGAPTGLYGPADPVTLEQIAKVVTLAAGIDATSCAVPPKNLSASGSWSASYVSCAEARGWAVYSDNAADVRLSATREQVVMTVLQAFEREFDVDAATLTFTDVEKTGAYAPAIAKAAADGVVSGYTDADGRLTGLFGPTNDVTRAEFAKIVTVALQVYAPLP